MPPIRQIVLEYVEIVYDGVLDPFLDAQEDACRLVFSKDGACINKNKAPTIWRENHKN